MVLYNPNNWHWVNKNASNWTKTFLEDSIKNIKAEENGVIANVNKVVSMDGDVEVNQRRGRVTSIFDVKLVIEYSGSTKEDQNISGTITVPEIAHDTLEHEYIFEIDVYSDSTAKKPVKELVRSKIVPQLRKEFVKLGPALRAEHGKDIQHAPGSSLVGGAVTTKSQEPSSETSTTKIQTQTQENINHSIVNTTTVTDTEEFQAPASELYKTFTDPARISVFTRAPPKLFEVAKVGGKFELFGGNVVGEYLELVEPTKIVQSWRLDQWPKGHFSRLEIEFDQNNVDSVTVMRVSWSGVPIGQEEVTKRNWKEYYVRSIKQNFGFGLIL